MRTSETTSEVMKDSSQNKILIEGVESGLERMVTTLTQTVAPEETLSLSHEEVLETSVDPLMRLKVHVQMLAEIRSRMQFMNREISYLLNL